ncbi:type II secretion system F family protein [Streptomyces sp. McG8]|uniref:type II secretion system F family protein n=1 Tax=Streptomyces sp. McG8 TaxID=2725487 RepID=UPI001BEC60A9|nr:type II secretion system F family protein [Streptomyces sp. McG8]WSB48615.1 type II secretion system F family protein [Streptomyces cellulosae]WSB92448.1 type II secretion system F family protein [Streptomyces cellulosae]
MSGDVVHRLGTLAGIAAVLVGASAWWHRLRCERRTRRRLDALAARERRRTGARLPLLRAVGGRLPYVAVVGAGWVTVGGLGGVGLGTVLAAGLWQWHRRQRRAAAEASASDAALDTALAARQLPLAADLLSACITAGAGPVPAAQAVGETLGGPVGDALARGAAEVRLGGEPGEAWRRLAALPGAVPLARLLERADVSGLPLAAPVGRLAAEARAEWSRSATARARRAAVLISAPVGLCFLPAFIAVGVLPVVIGLAGGVLEGGG